MDLRLNDKEQEIFVSYYLILVGTYVVASLGTFYYDIYKNKNAMNYKKIGTINKEEIKELYIYYLPRVSFNLFIGSIPFIYFTVKVLPVPIENTEHSLRVSNIIGEICLAKYSMDISFYITHRILHIPPLYEWFHKKHHEVKNPIGISAIYTTIGDLYFANLLPIAWVPLLVITSSLIYKFWVILSILSTVCIAHSGYRDLSEFHDIHHRYFKYNYGNSYFMDKMLGTYYHEDNLLKLRKKELLNEYTQTDEEKGKLATIKESLVVEDSIEDYIARKL